MLTLTNRIDMRPGAVPLVIHLGQYDSDFSLVFELYSSAGNFTVESGTTAMIRGTKTDGHAYDADATIDVSAKTVTVAGSEQMTAAKGRNVYELVLKKGTKVLSTANFILDVERAAMDADTIASESVLKELNAIIAGAETATEAAANAASAADRAEDAAESVSSASTQIATNTADIADLKADLSESVTDLKSATSQIVGWVESPNIYNGSYTQYKNLEPNGSLTDHTSRGVTNFIDVEPNTTYYVYIGINQVKVNYVRCLQYDADGNVISSATRTNATEFTTVASCKQVRLSVAMDYLNNHYEINTIATAGTYHEYFEPHYEAKLTEDDIKDYVKTNDSYLLIDNLNTVETLDQLPNYWVSYLQERVQTIRDYLKNGLDLSVFMVVTDTHYMGVAPMNIVAAVPKYVAVNLNVPRLLHIGDIINSGGTLETNRSRAINAMRKLRHAFKEVLCVRGNHDDNGYQSDFNKVFTQTDFFSLVYRGMDVVFGGDGSYYYKDDPNEKTRYIGLNAVDNIYEQSSGGGLLEKHNAFGFAQMEWLCETLLNTPSGYSIVLFDHTMLSDSIVTQENPTTSPQTFSLNYKVINDILYAYKTRSALNNYVVTCDFSTNYASYYSGTLNYDFSDCDGTIVGVWSGHEHVDTINTLKTSSGVDTGIYNIETQNSSFMFEPSVVSYPYQATMETGTITEYVYDVVVVNRKTKHVDLFRIGAGNTPHRQFDY